MCHFNHIISISDDNITQNDIVIIITCHMVTNSNTHQHAYSHNNRQPSVTHLHIIYHKKSLETSSWRRPSNKDGLTMVLYSRKPADTVLTIRT